MGQQFGTGGLDMDHLEGHHNLMIILYDILWFQIDNYTIDML